MTEKQRLLGKFVLSTACCLLSLAILSCRLTGFPEGDFFPIDPGDLSFVRQSNVPAMSSVTNMTLYNNFAFVADGNGRLGIHDVTSSLTPITISSITIPDVQQSIRRIEVDWRNNLYVAAGVGGLHVINASNTHFPVVVASHNQINAADLSLYEDYIAVIDNNGWRLLEVVSSSHLSELFFYDYFIPRQPMRILMRGNWVFVASRDFIDIFDITNPFNVRLERQIRISGFVDFDILDNRFLVVATFNRLLFIDITSPLNADIASDLVPMWTPHVIRAHNNYLFISWTNRSLSAYRILTITSLREESRKEFPQLVRDIDFRGNLIFLSNGINGFDIYSYVR